MIAWIEIPKNERARKRTSNQKMSLNIGRDIIQRYKAGGSISA